MIRDYADLALMGACMLVPGCIMRRIGCNRFTSTAAFYRLLHR